MIYTTFLNGPFCFSVSGFYVENIVELITNAMRVTFKDKRQNRVLKNFTFE